MEWLIVLFGWVFMLWLLGVVEKVLTEWERSIRKYRRPLW